MIFHDYPFAAPRFFSLPATRCLRCKSARLDTEDVVQNADEDWSEQNPPQERTFWFCRDCSGADAVNIGVGAMNEVARRVLWHHKYLQSADEGTEGVLLAGGEPLYQIDFDDQGRIEIVSLRGYLPSVDEALSQVLAGPNDWPLQVATRASAFGLGILAAKFLAFNSLPLGALSGGFIVLCLLEAMGFRSERFTAHFQLLGFLAILSLSVAWAIALLGALSKLL